MSGLRLLIKLNRQKNETKCIQETLGGKKSEGAGAR